MIEVMLASYLGMRLQDYLKQMKEKSEELEKERIEKILKAYIESDRASITKLYNEKTRPRIFLCHASSNKDVIRKIYRWLKSNDFDPWLDEEDLLAGQEWELEIKKAVRSSNVILVCLSKDSVSKVGYVQKEIKIALDFADYQPEGNIYIIPTKIEECILPECLKKYHYINLFEENGYNKLQKSLNAIKENKYVQTV